MKNDNENFCKLLNLLHSAVVQLVGDLTVDAGGATPGSHGVLTSVAFDATLLTKLSSEKEERDARRDAREEEVESSALTSPIGILTQHAAPTECAAQTWSKIDIFLSKSTRL